MTTASATWPAGDSAGLQLSLPHPGVVALAALLLLTAINPVGFHGGGWDDWHYLEAARCGAERGLCVPTSHWWTRWPLVAPMAGTLWVFGESRVVLWVVPAVYAVAATLLFAQVMERQFGRRAAMIASLALVATPVFNERALNPNVDLVELTWGLAALWTIQSAVRESRSGWAALSGLFLAVAVIARPTAVTLVPIAALTLWLAVPPARKLLLPCAAGFAAALAAEALGYWLWAGDGVLGWRLALGHTGIPSSELAAGVDLSQSPLFNSAYIDGWRPAAGIELFWPVDPLLNLLAHPAIGTTLVLAAVAMILGRRGLPDGSRRACFALVMAAVMHSAALIYALAIDPKPRMFLFEAAAAAAIIGACGAALWRRPAAVLVPLGIGLLAAKSIAAQHDAIDLAAIEPVAASWIAAEDAPVATDDFTRKLLTLVPLVNSLSRDHARAPVRSVLLLKSKDCSPPIALAATGSWRTARALVLAPHDGAIASRLRILGLLTKDPEVAALCLFRRQ